ncbi:hypothetical protein H5410_061005 [Solanum commersonii]|uniref:Uncharacterized protein n=1 Tax=Solanum commersonii TaxID=4109 RepID=A0A9J5W7C1_SOLCO|nr:hypothetical protein H5410_061005 [Solanum commersonii]
MSNYLSLILFRPTSTLLVLPTTTVSHLLIGAGHSHLLPNSVIPNIVAPSMPTHPSQHPHLCNMHLLNMLQSVAYTTYAKMMVLFMLLNIFDVQWVMPASIKEVL